MKIDIKIISDIIKYTLFNLIAIFLCSCVAPPKYTDGLLENIPAVINDDDYFSLSVFGNDFKDSLSWDLDLDISENDVLFTALIIKDLNVLSSDSSLLIMTIDLGDTIFNVNILNDLLFTSKDSIKFIGIPNYINFIADNFTGRLEYQLIKNPD